MDVPNCFDDGSDSDTLPPKRKRVRTITFASKPKPAKEKIALDPPIVKTKSGKKESQISRLLARREDALLEANGEKGDEALFKHDLSLCGENAAYSRPVDGFGEMMLRSMGWDGKKDTSEDAKLVPRPSRLGLGAKRSVRLPTDKEGGDAPGKNKLPQTTAAEMAENAVDENGTEKDGGITIDGGDGIQKRRREQRRSRFGSTGEQKT